MYTKPMPSAAEIAQYVQYDPEMGSFFWLERSEAMMPNHMSRRRWNTRYAGRPAGGIGLNGYLSISIADSSYYAHRLAWKLMHGSDPGIIDHIDGNPINNRISNLRNTTVKGNRRNGTRAAHNTSGTMGVNLAPNGKWRAYIKQDGRQVSLGTYLDKADAIAARKAAEQDMGYHKNHGREKVNG